jgi:hypothetical protein
MASIGPVSNAIFANQQTAGVASIQNAHNNRVDMQNMQAAAAVNEKDEKVLKVRPTEENHEVDPDREHQKNEADQENARAKHDDKEEESKENTSPPLHKLDIKV